MVVQAHPGTASYPDVSLDVRAKEGGKETTGETSGRSCFQDGGKSNGDERLNTGMAPTCNWRIKIVSK